MRSLPSDMGGPKFAIKVSILPDDILDRNREQLLSWENEEEPTIEFFGDSIKINGKSPEEFFGEEVLEIEEPEPKNPKAKMSRIPNDYTQEGIRIVL